MVKRHRMPLTVSRDAFDLKACLPCGSTIPMATDDTDNGRLPRVPSTTQHGGYEFKFVQGMDGNLEDIFMCKICYLPSRDPQLSVCCGHTFCKSCLDVCKSCLNPKTAVHNSLHGPTVNVEWRNSIWNSVLHYLVHVSHSFMQYCRNNAYMVARCRME